MPEIWIRTSEAEDVAGSIRHVLRAFQFVDEDLQVWKWVMLALHSALQGACVCHLTTTTQPLGAVTEKNAKEWRVYFNDARADAKLPPPKTFLMALPELLKAVRQPNSAGDGRNPRGVSITDAELNRLKYFHTEIRNQWVHFESMNWSIDVSGIPDIAKMIARIIIEMLDIGYAFRHLECAERNALRHDLESLALEN